MLVSFWYLEQFQFFSCKQNFIKKMITNYTPTMENCPEIHTAIQTNYEEQLNQQ